MYTELFISNKFVSVKLPPAGNISFLSEGPEEAIDMAAAAWSLLNYLGHPDILLNVQLSVYMSGKLYHGLNLAAGTPGALSFLSNFTDISSLIMENQEELGFNRHLTKANDSI